MGLADSFDDAVTLYDTARPGYPADAIAWAMPGTPRRVVDLGAGTGILTAALTGFDVVAVDPSAAMLARLRERLPGVETRIGTGDATGLRTASADAVLAASAFHWFARPDADAEIARILKPGGTVGLLWNPIASDDPLRHVFASTRAEFGLHPTEYGLDVELDRRWFGPTQRSGFRFSRTSTVAGFVDQLASRSYVITAPEAERARVLARAEAAAAAASVDGTVQLTYAVTALRARVHSRPM